MYDSGIRNIEIALRTDSAKKSVDNIVNSQIPMNVGIGTILTIDDLIFAKQVGANFGLSPSVDAPIVKKSIELDFTSFLEFQHQLIFHWQLNTELINSNFFQQKI